MRNIKNVVVDFEFCKVNKKQRSLTGTHLYQEIIEFGAIMLDENMNVIGKFQKFVKPQYGTVSAFISNLTGIAPDMLEEEQPFNEVLTEFLQWIGEY